MSRGKAKGAPGKAPSALIALSSKTSRTSGSNRVSPVFSRLQNGCITSSACSAQKVRISEYLPLASDGTYHQADTQLLFSNAPWAVTQGSCVVPSDGTRTHIADLVRHLIQLKRPTGTRLLYVSLFDLDVESVVLTSGSHSAANQGKDQAITGSHN